MEGCLALHATSPYVVRIAERVPLTKADEAQRRLRAGGIDGRLVLMPR